MLKDKITQFKTNSLYYRHIYYYLLLIMWGIMNGTQYWVTRKIDGLKKEDLSSGQLPYFAETKVKRIVDKDGKSDQRGVEIFPAYEGNFVKLEKGVWKSEEYGEKTQMLIHFTMDNGEQEVLKCNVSSITRQLMNKLASVKEVGKLKLVLGASVADDGKVYPRISVQVDGEKIKKEDCAISREEQDKLVEVFTDPKGKKTYYYDKLDDKLFELCEKITPIEKEDEKFEAPVEETKEEKPVEEDEDDLPF